jgi:hypothetical protein
MIRYRKRMQEEDAGRGCRKRIQEEDAGRGCRKRMQDNKILKINSTFDFTSFILPSFFLQEKRYWEAN